MELVDVGDKVLQEEGSGQRQQDPHQLKEAAEEEVDPAQSEQELEGGVRVPKPGLVGTWRRHILQPKLLGVEAPSLGERLSTVNTSRSHQIPGSDEMTSIPRYPQERLFFFFFECPLKRNVVKRQCMYFARTLVFSQRR